MVFEKLEARFCILVPSVQNSDVKIKVYDEEKAASSCSHSGEEGSGGHSGEGGSDSESIPCSQSPVAIESYLPWKDSLDFETPNVTFGLVFLDPVKIRFRLRTVN